MRIAYLFCAVLVFTACKKEYTCTCTTRATANIQGLSSIDLGSQTQQYTAKLKKKEKEKWCKGFENSTTSNPSIMPGISVTANVVTTCTL